MNMSCFTSYVQSIFSNLTKALPLSLPFCKPRERLIAWVGLVAWALEGTCESHFNHFLEAFGHDVKLKLVQLTWQNPILSQGDVLSILVLQSSSPNWTTSSHHAWQLSSYHSSSHKLFSHSSSQALKMLPWYKNTETSSYEHIRVHAHTQFPCVEILALLGFIHSTFLVAFSSGATICIYLCRLLHLWILIALAREVNSTTLLMISKKKMVEEY